MAHEPNSPAWGRSFTRSKLRHDPLILLALMLALILSIPEAERCTACRGEQT
jgi:hypothetical protein